MALEDEVVHNFQASRPYSGNGLALYEITKHRSKKEVLIGFGEQQAACLVYFDHMVWHVIHLTEKFLYC